MKYKIFKALFIIWIIVWAVFLAREIFAKGALKDYRILLSRPLEGKHSYVTGGRLYEYLSFCDEKLPQGAAYSLIGLEEGSIEKRRAVYYLYPHLERDAAYFLLVFDKPDFTAAGYRLFARLDGARYILIKADKIDNPEAR